MIVDIPGISEGWINAHHAGGMAIRYAGVYLDKATAQEEGRAATKRSGWRVAYRIHVKRKPPKPKRKRSFTREQRIADYLEIISSQPED